MLYLITVEKIRTDVYVAQIPMDEQVTFIQNHPQNQPIFLALTEPYYDMDGIRQHYTIIPEGLVYKLE